MKILSKIISAFIIGGIMVSELHARPMAVAGTFYPADKKELAAFVDETLKNGRKHISGITAVVVPHAGYVFSGRLAGEAFSAINQSYDLVVVMSTGHTHGVKGAGLLAADDYETPLGRIETDRELAASLMIKEPLFENFPEAHQREHGIEVELPFLQRKLKKPFKLLAMTLNYAGDAEVKRMAKALAAELKERKVLIVISTDLSHYTDTVNAKYTDEAFAESVKTMNSDFIRLTSRILMAKKIPGLQTVACGETALLLGLETSALLGAKSFKLGKVSDSHRQHPAAKSPGRVVGYMNGWFLRSGQPPQNKLNGKEKKFLLSEARRTLQDYFENKDNPAAIKNPKLNLPGAVFVTLTKNGNLRGCIGTVQPHMGIYDAVRYGAVSAAFRDRRFQPLRIEELDKIKIELSVLSRMNPDSWENIIPQKHGVLIKRGMNSGLFLPQVWKQIPDRDSFMGELCQQKAGLPRDCWKQQGTEIYTFTTDSFEETPRGLKENSKKEDKKTLHDSNDSSSKPPASGNAARTQTEMPKLKTKNNGMGLFFGNGGSKNKKKQK